MVGSQTDRWEEIEINTWDEFDTEIENQPHREWLYRGQSDAAWPIKTSLYRLFEDAQAIIKSHKGKARRFEKDEHENLLIRRFMANAHLFLTALPEKNDKLEWLSLMQHYGAPTRMLDVTLSPHIASYFALEHGHADFAIFAFNYKFLKLLDEEALDIDCKKSEIFNNHKKERSFILAHESKFANERLLSQQGLFLVPSTNYHTFDELLAEYGGHGEACKKFIINGNMRYEGIERLKQMNITSTSLFPGVDGFCRSLNHQIYENTSSQKLFD